MAETRAAPAAAACVAVERRRLVVRGVVQGVGFRPFVWGLATRRGLAGSVRNTSGAVVVEVEGAARLLDDFERALHDEAPRLARISAVETGALPPRGDSGFSIDASLAVAGEYQPISPDAATCPQCREKILDPGDRRHGYAFTNCTSCGPRFTIIEDVPYDRSRTTMRRFAMCAACSAEYHDPADRRFHAQPNACPECGPRLWLAGGDGIAVSGDPLSLAAAALRDGRIVALKGLGGFQLACDARDAAAVAALRTRKARPGKPFAVMVEDLDAARSLCHAGGAEAELLSGTVRPIVLLRRRSDDGLAGAVAPGLHELGVMLPYTPLHHLLLGAAGMPLVMTSGNRSEEPIARDNDEALRRLHGVADLFLLHDRHIHARYDDSVVRVTAGGVQMIRRARGHCPLPVELPDTAPAAVLALGAHLKNTFCVLQDGHAFVGPHIGDLDNPLALRHQRESLEAYLGLFRAEPRVVACDLHPDYASTRLAERWWEDGARRVQVQHHHAHIASVMAEHRLRGRLLGIACDGTGYGPDGTVWGGELLLCDERSYQRVGHLAPVRQPGGDRCAREGWRMALAYLRAAGLPEGTPVGGVDDQRWRWVARIADADAVSPLSTSGGRLFDAVAALLGVAAESTYEGEAAMRLEALASTAPTDVRALDLPCGGSPLVLDTPSLVGALLAEHGRGRPLAEVAALFHESLAQGFAQACHRLAREHGVTRVALSGGVFQNRLLLDRTSALLRDRDLEPWSNREVPANDGGISLGQALVAATQKATP